MTDIVERLRALARMEHSDFTIGAEAADEIERRFGIGGELIVARRERDIYKHQFELEERDNDTLRKQVSDMQARVAELRENGDRLRAVADSAVQQQKDMIDAALAPWQDRAMKAETELYRSMGGVPKP